MVTVSSLFFACAAFVTLTHGLNVPYEVNRFPRPLSDKVATVYEKVYDIVAKYPQESGITADRVGTSGEFIDQVLEYGNIDSHCPKIFYPAIMAAKEEVLITTFLFDRNTPCAKWVKKALIEMNQALEGTGRKIRVYMVICTISLLSFWKKPDVNLPDISNIIIPLKEANPLDFDLPSKHDLPNLDYKIKSYFKFTAGAIHSKLLVVDGNTLVMGSKNLDDFVGMEYAVRLEGPVALSARADFKDAWGEELPPPPSESSVDQPSLGEYPLLYLPRCTNGHLLKFPERNAQDVAWLTAMDVAKDEVFIYTPSFNCKTIYDKVLQTVRRGVDVTIITNYMYEDFGQKLYPDNEGTNIKTVEKIYKDLAKDSDATFKRLNICYFIGKRVQPPKPSKDELSHVKFMSIDDEFYIFGSGNQDAQSWHHSREVNLLVDDPMKTIQIKRLMLSNQQSLEFCFRDKHGRIKMDPVIDIPSSDIDDTVN